MDNKEAVKTLIAHRTRFMNDFGWDHQTIKALDIAIASLTAESKPVVRGRWVSEGENAFEWCDYKCSVCGQVPDYFVYGMENWGCGELPNFCPNCGAKMREEEKNE